MSLSPVADQHRDRQSRFSRPVFAWGAVGSIVFHAGLFPALLLMAWRAEPPEPAQIEIVVTDAPEIVEEELPEEEAETAVLGEETVDEVPQPQATSTPVAAVPEPASTTEPPPMPQEPLPEETPDESAVEEDSLEETPEDEISEAEPDTQPDAGLDALLEAVRRRQQRRGEVAGDRPTESGNSSPTAANNQTTGDEDSRDRDEGEQTVARANPPDTDSSGGGARTVACRSCPKPSYPRSALDAGAEGTVNIMVDISAEGGVTSASLVGSSGHAALDQAALAAVRNRWRFQPISRGASGVVVSVVMTIQGSDLNRRATERGDRESVDIPADEPVDETATQETEPDSPSASPASPDEPPEAEQPGADPTETPPSEAAPSDPLPLEPPTLENESPASSPDEAEASDEAAPSGGEAPPPPETLEAEPVPETSPADSVPAAPVPAPISPAPSPADSTAEPPAPAPAPPAPLPEVTPTPSEEADTGSE
ncbi:MAG: TonB family protein [Elainellaceae cyanobacterium]